MFKAGTLSSEATLVLQTSRSDVFQETTMEVDVSGDFMHLLQSLTPEYAVQPYGFSG